MVVSTPTGPVMRTTASDVHGRHLNEVSASTVAEFMAAMYDRSVNKILLAVGTYEITTTTREGTVVVIDRDLTIEAEVPGAVVLNGMVFDPQSGRPRRVFQIDKHKSAKLIGLNITGGHGESPSVQSVCLLNPLWHFIPSPCTCFLNFLNLPRQLLYVCSCLVVWRGNLGRRHGNADQYQRVRQSGVLAF